MTPFHQSRLVREDPEMKGKLRLNTNDNLMKDLMAQDPDDRDGPAVALRIATASWRQLPGDSTLPTHVESATHGESEMQRTLTFTPIAELWVVARSHRLKSTTYRTHACQTAAGSRKTRTFARFAWIAEFRIHRSENRRSQSINLPARPQKKDGR
jgi:hypothetical protein